MTNVQDNVFFFKAEVRGQAFFDRNGNGRQDKSVVVLAGVSVELLNDDGDVVASTVTDSSGRYRFTQFRETGDYQVRCRVEPAPGDDSQPGRCAHLAGRRVDRRTGLRHSARRPVGCRDFQNELNQVLGLLGA